MAVSKFTYGSKESYPHERSRVSTTWTEKGMVGWARERLARQNCEKSCLVPTGTLSTIFRLYLTDCTCACKYISVNNKNVSRNLLKNKKKRLLKIQGFVFLETEWKFHRSINCFPNETELETLIFPKKKTNDQRPIKFSNHRPRIMKRKLVFTLKWYFIFKDRP